MKTIPIAIFVWVCTLSLCAGSALGTVHTLSSIAETNRNFNAATDTAIASRYRQLFDSGGLGMVPAINNQNAVAFLADLHTGQFETDQAIVRVDGNTATAVAEAVSLLQPPPSGPVQFRALNPQPRINNNGSVVFSALTGPTILDPFAIVRDDNGVQTAVMVGDGSSIVPGQGAVISHRLPPDINNAGTVVFEGGLENGLDGIFTGTGGPLTTVIDNSANPDNLSFSRPLINDNGIVIYRVSLAGTDTRRILSTAGGVVADTNTGFLSLGGFSVNNNGHVAYTGTLDNGVSGLFVGAAGPRVDLADSTGPLNSFSDPSINNSGRVAYLGHYDVGGGRAVFDGPDTVLDRVIGTGDPLFGSIVKAIDFGEQGFNDAGNLTFAVELVNGEQHIVRTSPLRITPQLASRFENLALISTVNGESMTMSQTLPAPPSDAPTLLDFKYRFFTTDRDSALVVTLNDMTLGILPAIATSGHVDASLPVDLQKLFPTGDIPSDVTIAFQLLGADLSLELDDVFLEGTKFQNGGFDQPDFAGWEFDTSGGGSAAVVGRLLVVPEPAGAVLVAAGLVTLLGRRRLRRPTGATI